MRVLLANLHGWTLLAAVNLLLFLLLKNLICFHDQSHI